jgi:dTDP-4-dehydrorhamnose reductase
MTSSARHHILVFGREGQVATELRQASLPKGWSLEALGRSSLDITCAPAVEKAVAAIGPTVVVNAAAYTAVDRAESEPEQAFAVNRDGTLHIAQACTKAGIPLIHLSTDYVFDGRLADRAYREDDPVNPLGVYGVSKEAGERAVRENAPAHVIMRTAWVYSAHGQNFLKTMLRLGQERPEFRIVDDQRGCPTSAADIAAAVIEVSRHLAAGRTDCFGTFHYCGTGATTWFGFASEIFALAAARGINPPCLHPITTADYPLPATRPANSVLECTRMRSLYGISAPDWRESLKRCLDQVLDARIGEAA